MRILFLFIFLLATTFQAKANTINVCGSCEVTSIKKAVSLAKKGDTIVVKQGVYKETLININKALHIIGENYPIIDAENKMDTIFTIRANNFNISGFRFRNIGMSYTKEVAAVFITNSKNFTIENNI
ncbi:MAG: nitrous oxide reductase family maturation protein NosD, partial [Polaribacter sp.]|nr:nitrous oxide reductase family maturation protein NosD [Polaribacter sp.]